MAASRVRVHAIVKGEVQGVGFRAWTVRQAEQLGISGWVKNRLDGSVEALCEGERDKIERMLEALHRGPRMGRVDVVEVREAECLDEFAGFEVEYE